MTARTHTALALVQVTLTISCPLFKCRASCAVLRYLVWHTVDTKIVFLIVVYSDKDAIMTTAIPKRSLN